MNQMSAPTDATCDLCAGKCRGHSLLGSDGWEPEPGSRSYKALKQPAGADREAIARAIAAEIGRQDGGSPFTLDEGFCLSWLDQGEVDFGKVADAVLALRAVDALPDGATKRYVNYEGHPELGSPNRNHPMQAKSNRTDPAWNAQALVERCAKVARDMADAFRPALHEGLSAAAMVTVVTAVAALDEVAKQIASIQAYAALADGQAGAIPNDTTAHKPDHTQRFVSTGATDNA
jgi:hypothetical protein